jgi:hypothetical protein
VSGVCRERIVITTDRITLDGQGSAVLDGGGGGPAELSGAVAVDGAKGVTIVGFTIQNSPGEGILGQRAASFTVRNTVVQDNPGTGIAVGDGSAAELIDVTSRRNGAGLDIYTGSTAILRGAIALNANAAVGAAINGLSVLEIRGAHVQASDNGASGSSPAAASSPSSGLRTPAAARSPPAAMASPASSSPARSSPRSRGAPSRSQTASSGSGP